MGDGENSFGEDATIQGLGPTMASSDDAEASGESDLDDEMMAAEPVGWVYADDELDHDEFEVYDDDFDPEDSSFTRKRFEGHDVQGGFDQRAELRAAVLAALGQRGLLLSIKEQHPRAAAIAQKYLCRVSQNPQPG